jgi:hypothetical protein
MYAIQLPCAGAGKAHGTLVKPSNKNRVPKVSFLHLIIAEGRVCPPRASHDSLSQFRENTVLSRPRRLPRVLTLSHLRPFLAREGCHVS